MQFAGGVAVDCFGKVAAQDSMTIVTHLQAVEATFLDFNFNLGRFRIQ